MLITAAHCIETYGQGAAGLADAIQLIPAEFSTAAGGPYGVWTGRFWAVTPPYANGTDTCDVDADGVACDNDIALVVLNQRNINGVLTWPGKVVGYYAVAVNGYSFVTSPLLGNKRVGDITQLGYPSAFDDGVQMQRTNSIGIYQSATGAATTNGKVLRTDRDRLGADWRLERRALVREFRHQPRHRSGGDARQRNAGMAIVGVRASAATAGRTTRAPPGSARTPNIRRRSMGPLAGQVSATCSISSAASRPTLACGGSFSISELRRRASHRGCARRFWVLTQPD